MKEEGTVEIEAYVSRYLYLMHILNVMLKDLRVSMRVSFERDDKTDTGMGINCRLLINIVRNDVLREVFRKIAPIGLCDTDEEDIIAIFRAKDTEDMFAYKQFLEVLNAIDALKPNDSQVPLVGICYALLMAIITTFDGILPNMTSEIKQKLCTDNIIGEYLEYLTICAENE